MTLQDAKRVVLAYCRDLDRASEAELAAVIRKHSADDYRWRGVHPFNEQFGADGAAEAFWVPLRESFTSLQRRPDVFMAGADTASGDGAVWVCQMGHLLGLFDRPWLDIPPTGRMCLIRFCEFNRVDGEQIAETALFVDVVSVMRQAGQYPLPPQTGAAHMHLGPATHDGLLFDAQDPDEGAATMRLVERLVEDLAQANQVANETGDNHVPRSVLEATWHSDMIWSGPDGIGATYTIDRYEQQHQYPFRLNLSDKRFNGHVARLAEGDYASFFGWANLTNVAGGGFLGMTGGGKPADMRVADVYRRDGDRLAENWVFIDLLHWLNMQGLDVLARMRQLLGEDIRGREARTNTIREDNQWHQ